MKASSVKHDKQEAVGSFASASSNGLLFTKRKKAATRLSPTPAFSLTHLIIQAHGYIHTINISTSSCPSLVPLQLPLCKQRPTVADSAQVACLAPLETLKS